MPISLFRPNFAASAVVLVLFCGAARGQDARPEYEHRAVAFPADATLATKTLNALAADGWEYVGPLAHPLVAFRRRVANEDSAAEVRRLDGHTGFVTMAAFAPDGSVLASGAEDGTVLLWDPKTGRLVKMLEGHTGGVLHVSYSPDGKTLTSSSRDKTVVLWDTATGTKRATLDEHGGAVSCALYSPDGKTLATAADDALVIVRDAAGKMVRKLEGHRQPAIALAHAPDGATLVSGGGDWNSSERGGELKAWDLATGKERWSAGGMFGGIWGVAYSPDGKTLAAACLDGTIRLFDPASGKERLVLRGHADRAIWVAFAPSGRTLASTSYDGTARLWDPATGREKAVLKGHTAALQRLAFAADGKTLATTATDNTLRLWRLR